jgi:hypothetical protein
MTLEKATSSVSDYNLLTLKNCKVFKVRLGVVPLILKYLIYAVRAARHKTRSGAPGSPRSFEGYRATRQEGIASLGTSRNVKTASEKWKHSLEELKNGDGASRAPTPFFIHPIR